MGPTIVLLSLMLLLLVVVYEDFVDRAVHVWLFPLMITVALFMDTVHLSWEHIAVNFSVIAIQFFVLTAYFSFKHKQYINITQLYLGWGDILFWLVLCCLFSPLNFIVFYMVSLCLSIACSLVIPVFHARGARIPLAGLQALTLMCCLTLAQYKGIALRNDDLMLEWLLV